MQAVVEAAAAGDTTPVVPPYPNLAAYRSSGGYAVYDECRGGARSAADTEAAITNAGLRGMGGAGFPAALQHDTVLRPKDCGGPVVDLNGHVVGLNIARAGRTATYVLPTEVILPLLDDLKSGKLPPPVALTGPIGPAPPPLPVDVNE